MDKAHTKALALATRERYRMIADALIERFEQEQGKLWQESRAEFSSWINEAVAPKLAASSRRQYRAALTFYYTDTGLAGNAAPVFRSTGKQRSSTKREKRQTSATRSKGFRNADYEVIVHDLAARRAYMAQLAGAMLVSSQAFGLRPQEWAHTDVRSRLRADRTREYWLEVRNAKHSHGRAFGQTRTLAINGPRLGGHEIDAAIYTSDAMHVYVREYRNDHRGQHDDETLEAAAVKTALTAMNRHLRNARKRLGIRRHYTMYSARHQFAADAKAAGLAPEHIAALLGHASIKTAATHYGKRRNGRRGNADGFRVTPSPQDVAAVEALNRDLAAVIEAESTARPNWVPTFLG